MKAGVSLGALANAPTTSSVAPFRAGGKARHQDAVGGKIDAQLHLVEAAHAVELVGAAEHGAHRIGAEDLALAEHRKAAALLGLAVVGRRKA